MSTQRCHYVETWQRRIRGAWSGLVCLGLAFAASPPPDFQHQAAVRVFDESFSSYAYKAAAAETEWDTTVGELGLLPQDTVSQESPSIVAVPGEGAFVVWLDGRNGGQRVYAQRLDASGNRVWPQDVLVSTVATTVWQATPAIVLEGSGGVVIAWSDSRTGTSRIYLQRLSASGIRLWAQDVPLSVAAANAQEEPTLSLSNPDPLTGHVSIAWSEERSAISHIYAQQVGLDGNRRWSQDLQVSELHQGFWQYYPQVITGSAGSTWITWEDATPNADRFLLSARVYLQRLDSSGQRLNPTDIRLDVDSLRAFHHTSALSSDGNGGTWVAWNDYAQNGDTIRLEHFASNGMPQTVRDVDRVGTGVDAGRVAPQANPIDGVEIGPGQIALASDGAGGVFLAYPTGSSETTEIMATRLDATGNILWPQAVRLHHPQLDTEQTDPILAADGAGGFWGVWGDYRRARGDVFVQRVDGQGQWRWFNELRCHWDSGAAIRDSVQIRLDADDNAWLTWIDTRRGVHEPYLQRLSPTGERLLADTVLASAAPPGATTPPGPSQEAPSLAVGPDNSILVTWWDRRADSGDLYGQAHDALGNRLWLGDRILQRGTNGQSTYSAMVGDGAGGFFVVWQDHRSGRAQVYAQHVQANGDLLWPADVQVSDEPLALDQIDPTVVLDGQGGIVVAWWDNRASAKDVFVQRLDANGAPMWPADVRASAVPNTEASNWVLFIAGMPGLVSDGAGGALVAWYDSRTGTQDIYVQRVSATGQRQWASDLRVSQGPSDSPRASPMLAANGNEFRVAWSERRSGATSSRIYLQRISSAGAVLWPADVAVGQALGQDQFGPELAVRSDGGAVLVWIDHRNAGRDIYAQRLDALGAPLWASDVPVVMPQRFVVPFGTAESTRLNVGPEPVARATLTVQQTLDGGEVRYFLSNTGGASWQATTPGQPVVFSSPGSDLRWRAELRADPLRAQGPHITHLRVEYETGFGAGDTFEVDDACVAARPVVVNGSSQPHTFHQVADADWARFDAVAGTTYVVQTISGPSNADTALELRPSCPQPPLALDDNAFGRDARITWSATYSGPVYLKIANHAPEAYGADTTYSLSVRTVGASPVALIVAGHDNGFSLQANINGVGDTAYRTLLSAGVVKANIRYLNPGPARDVDGNGLADDIAGVANPTAVRDAIQIWARERGVGTDVPFYLFLVDHGGVDQFLADGTAGRIQAADLDLWLSNLESTSGANRLTILIEACQSGSFIDSTALGLAELSGHNRVVVASTTSGLNAYPSVSGAYFSDAFWTAFGQSQDVHTAFQFGVRAVQATGLSQVPWLDDNGDAEADERDGALAQTRGLGQALGGSAPAIDWVSASATHSGEAILEAQVRDDFGVGQVWAMVYPPNFAEPLPRSDGTTPQLHLTQITLTASGNDRFTAVYTGLQARGLYRIVIYAADHDGYQAMPVARTVFTGEDVFLPLLQR